MTDRNKIILMVSGALVAMLSVTLLNHRLRNDLKAPTESIHSDVHQDP